MNCSIPASMASSTAYWTTGLSTTGSISLGMALVAGRKRVPMPATGKTALRTGLAADMFFPGDGFVKRLFHGMGPPLLSSFRVLAGLGGRPGWAGGFFFPGYCFLNLFFDGWGPALLSSFRDLAGLDGRKGLDRHIRHG